MFPAWLPRGEPDTHDGGGSVLRPIDNSSRLSCRSGIDSHMDLKHLRTFVAVADEGSVSNAALRLRIAQPALSRQISNLENELGLKLFDRVGRRLVVSAAGSHLLDDCRSLLGQVRSLNDRAHLLRHGDTGALIVGASAVQIETVLSTFLPRYAQRYPNIRVKLIESVSADTLTMLERGEIHLGISLLQTIQANDRHFGTVPVPPVELLAACHSSFQLERGETIEIGRIMSHPLLLLDSGFVARKTFDAVCRLAKLKPNILVESRAPHTLLALAEAGLGVAIIPSAVQTHRYKLRIVGITHERKQLREPRFVVWDKRRMLPRYAQDFCEMLAVHMREQLLVTRPSTSGVSGVARKPQARRKRPANIK
jgi:DNA-binding transcriptional LysR family regulator